MLVSSGVEVDAFETLVRPTRRLRDFNTGFYWSHRTRFSPLPRRWPEALRDFYRFVDGRPMVAHNGLRYDFPLLEATGLEAGVPVPDVRRLGHAGTRAPRLSSGGQEHDRQYRRYQSAARSKARRSGRYFPSTSRLVPRIEH